MNENYNVSSSPHIRDKVTSSNIMLMVVISLLPATFFGIWNFRHENAWILIVVTTAAAVLAEYLWEKLMHKPVTIKDFSAVVTGLLLALNLPPTLPWWMGVVGAFFAIIVVKQLFGGLGQNFMNPALGARCFLLICFAGKMTNFVYDGVTGYPTPLANLKAGESVDSFAMLIGNTSGTIGETSVIALMIGAMFLILMGVIDLRIPGTYILTFVIFISLFGGHGFDPQYITAHLCGGGLMLGAWFMATDYVTSPITSKGKDRLWYLPWMSDGSVPSFRRFCRRCILCDHHQQPARSSDREGNPAKAIWKRRREVMNKIVKNAFILTAITVIAGLLLGVVYGVTKEPIANAKAKAKQEAFQSVLSDADSFETVDNLDTDAASELLKSNGYSSDAIEEVALGKDKSGETIGYVINVVSHEGYGGDIEISVGIQADGTVKGIEMLSISETAGLGMKSTEPAFKDQFKDKK